MILACYDLIIMDTVEELAKARYAGNGSISLRGNRNQIEFRSPVPCFELSGEEDSSIHCNCSVDATAFFESGFPEYDAGNFDQTFNLEFSGECDDGSSVSASEACAVLTGTYGHSETGDFCSLRFYSRNAEITRSAAISGASVHSRRYHLANCPFFVPVGDKIVEGNSERAVPRISIRTPSIEIDLRCFKPDQENRAIGKTSSLILTPRVPIESERSDELAGALCAVLSLAKRNTVEWMTREDLDSEGRVLAVALKNANLLPFQRASTLIPDNCLGGFLMQCLPHYIANREEKDIDRTLRLLVEAEHHPIVDIKYALSFFAMETLKSNWLPEKERNGATINEGITALCNHFSVRGHSKKLGKLRSKLFHTGGIGGMSFEEVAALYLDLSGIVTECLLRALKYKGQYIRSDRSRIERRPSPYGDYREMVEGRS